MLRAALILAGLAGGLWLGGRRRLLDPPRPGGALPAISVVVPARDEATTLPVLLGSLAAQGHGPHEVLVVDDGSTDGTAEVAAAQGARVLAAPPRPEGWLGKPWACQAGAGAATGTHLLFLDADVALGPDALLRLAASHTGGLLTVQPHHRPERAHEQLSLFPNLVAVLGTAVAAVGGRPAMRGAFGPCLLTSRADHDRVGGHAAVAGEVVEDLALGDAYRAAGLPVDGRLGGDAVTYRMYPAGPAQLIEGWTKNLAAGAGRTGRVAALGATAWVAACAAVAGWAGGVVLRWALAGGPAPWSAAGGPAAPVVAAAAYALVAAQVAWLGRAVGRFRWWALALWPLPLAAFVALFVRSATRTLRRRPVTWRGRAVPTSRPPTAGRGAVATSGRPPSPSEPGAGR